MKLKKWKGLIVKVLEDTRIPAKERDPNLHYYECRHSESDWSQPCSVEKWVVVNFWGTIITRKSLPIPSTGDYIDLTKNEGEQLMFMANGCGEDGFDEEYMAAEMDA